MNHKPRLSVYQFTDYRAFLHAHVDATKATNPAFSMRSWCARLGFKSPATLNMILRGKRHPGAGAVAQFVSYFQFSQNQREYFERLVDLAKAKDNPMRLAHALEALRQIHPDRELHLVDLDTFAVNSNWYFFALREMVSSADFREEPEWISRKLYMRVSPKKTSDAIDLLLKTGWLVRDAHGFLNASESQITTNADISHEAIKRFHEQMLDLAKLSIRSTPVPLRDIAGSTFNIDLSELPAFKAELRKMRRQLYQRFERPKANATYQLNVQLFPLTRTEPNSGDKS